MTSALVKLLEASDSVKVMVAVWPEVRLVLVLVMPMVGGVVSALSVGDEQRFEVSYSCLLRAMTSPFVSRCFIEALDRSDC